VVLLPYDQSGVGEDLLDLREVEEETQSVL
jgi:hypothetical protein